MEHRNDTPVPAAPPTAAAPSVHPEPNLRGEPPPPDAAARLTSLQYKLARALALKRHYRR